MIDKRRFTRVSFHHQSVEFTHAGQVFPTTLLDISLKGALFKQHGDANLALGDSCG
jgi:hypothetical protein